MSQTSLMINSLRNPMHKMWLAGRLRAVHPYALVVKHTYVIERVRDRATLTKENTFIGLMQVDCIARLTQDCLYPNVALLIPVELNAYLNPIYSARYANSVSVFLNNTPRTFPVRYRFYEWPMQRDALCSARELVGVLIGSPSPNVRPCDGRSVRDCFLAYKKNRPLNPQLKLGDGNVTDVLHEPDAVLGPSFTEDTDECVEWQLHAGGV